MERATPRERIVLLFVGYGGSSLAATGLALLSQSLIVGAFPVSRGLGPAIAQLMTPIGAGLLLAGGFVAHAAHRTRTSSPTFTASATPASSGALALALALAIVVAGVWLSLGSLASLCADAANMMRTTGWLGASTPERSALLLLPFTAALIVPALQLAAACAFTAGALAVPALGSAPVRASVVRTFGLCLILQTALTGASAYGAAFADTLLASVESAVRGTAMSHLPIGGRRLALEILARYEPVVGAAAFTLDLALAANVIAAGLFATLAGMPTAEHGASVAAASPRPSAAAPQIALGRGEPAAATRNGVVGGAMLAGAALLLFYAVFGPRMLEPLLRVVGMP